MFPKWCPGPYSQHGAWTPTWCELSLSSTKASWDCVSFERFTAQEVFVFSRNCQILGVPAARYLTPLSEFALSSEHRNKAGRFSSPLRTFSAVAEQNSRISHRATTCTVPRWGHESRCARHPDASYWAHDILSSGCGLTPSPGCLDRQESKFPVHAFRHLFPNGVRCLLLLNWSLGAAPYNISCFLAASRAARKKLASAQYWPTSHSANASLYCGDENCGL
jgi:hypothetical protein